MFVKTGTGFKKLLDKKSLRIAAYGDSKGFRLLRKFICETSQSLGEFSLNTISFS